MAKRKLLMMRLGLCLLLLLTEMVPIQEVLADGPIGCEGLDQQRRAEAPGVPTESGFIPPNIFNAYLDANLLVPQTGVVIFSNVAAAVMDQGFTFETLARWELSPEQLQRLVDEMNRMHERFGITLKTKEAAKEGDRVLGIDRVSRLWSRTRKEVLESLWRVIMKRPGVETGQLLQGDFTLIGLGKAIDRFMASAEHEPEARGFHNILRAMANVFKDARFKSKAATYRGAFANLPVRGNADATATLLELKGLIRQMVPENLGNGSIEVPEGMTKACIESFLSYGVGA